MISTHVLDTHLGLPAAGIAVELDKKSGEKWTTLAAEKTNGDGRVSFNVPSDPGTYRLSFQTDAYFQKNKVAHFFPVVPVIFVIQETNRNFHVPLLLNPFGYSTYRGS